MQKCITQKMLSLIFTFELTIVTSVIKENYIFFHKSFFVYIQLYIIL